MLDGIFQTFCILPSNILADFHRWNSAFKKWTSWTSWWKSASIFEIDTPIKWMAVPNNGRQGPAKTKIESVYLVLTSLFWALMSISLYLNYISEAVLYWVEAASIDFEQNHICSHATCHYRWTGTCFKDLTLPWAWLRNNDFRYFWSAWWCYPLWCS